jgi:hypothetical protein
MDKFCGDCWEWVETVENDDEETVCADCEWVNVFDSEGEAVEAKRYDAELLSWEADRDEMMFSQMD